MPRNDDKPKIPARSPRKVVREGRNTPIAQGAGGELYRLLDIPAFGPEGKYWTNETYPDIKRIAGEMARPLKEPNAVKRGRMIVLKIFKHTVGTGTFNKDDINNLVEKAFTPSEFAEIGSAESPRLARALTVEKLARVKETLPGAVFRAHLRGPMPKGESLQEIAVSSPAHPGPGADLPDPLARGTEGVVSKVYAQPEEMAPREVKRRLVEGRSVFDPPLHPVQGTVERRKQQLANKMYADRLEAIDPEEVLKAHSNLTKAYQTASKELRANAGVPVSAQEFLKGSKLTPALKAELLKSGVKTADDVVEELAKTVRELDTMLAPIRKATPYPSKKEIAAAFAESPVEMRVPSVKAKSRRTIPLSQLGSAEKGAASLTPGISSLERLEKLARRPGAKMFGMGLSALMILDMLGLLGRKNGQEEQTS